MATSADYIEFTLEQLKSFGAIRAKKMFGEFMIYINDKPIFLVCDNTVFLKAHSEVEQIMKHAQTAFPYKGATKEYYIVDIEDAKLCKKLIDILEPILKVPKKKVKKQKD